MNKLTRVFAILGVVFLLGLYIMTFVASFTVSENSPGLFLASVYATIVIPVLIWAYSFFYKLFKKKKDEENNKTE